MCGRRRYRNVAASMPAALWPDAAAEPPRRIVISWTRSAFLLDQSWPTFRAGFAKDALVLAGLASGEEIRSRSGDRPRHPCQCRRTSTGSRLVMPRLGHRSGIGVQPQLISNSERRFSTRRNVTCLPFSAHKIKSMGVVSAMSSRRTLFSDMKNAALRNTWYRAGPNRELVPLIRGISIRGPANR